VEFACILVTGASGFVGRTLLPTLRRSFPNVRLVGTTLSDAVQSGPAEGRPDAMVTLDLLDRAAIGLLIREVEPDAIVHLAAASAVAASHDDPDGTWAINVDGTRHLAEAILSEAPQAIMLHASSAEVYGLSFKAANALDETAPMQPANPYAASKAASDIAIGEMALRGLRAIRFRPLNHIGPGQTPRFAVPAFARQIARIERGLQAPVLRTGALDRERDFLDVQDVCAAYAAALRQAETLPPAPVFNLASGKLRSLQDVLTELLAQAGVEARIDEAGVAPRPNDLLRTACSAETARRVLGWSPAIAWTQTLDDIIADWRDQAAQEAASAMIRDAGA
jgi:GDP-4-dehydro-6-deoxy-D-mannose reductase